MVIFLQLTYLWAIGFCFYTSGWLMLRADRNRTTWALAVCQLLIIIWCLPQLFLPLSVSREAKYLLYGVSYIGISFIGPSWLVFSFFYCQRQVRPAVRLLLFGISVFDYSMFLTNELHHLFYRSFELEQVVYGPLFYLHMSYTYICVLLGIGAVLRNFRKKKVAAVHMLVILLSSAVPLGFNVLYLSGLVDTGFDLTPPAFALSSFFMLLAVFRYDFLDVNVLAFEHIFESIAEGVIVCNKRGMLTYCNQAAEHWLGVTVRDSRKELWEKISRSEGGEAAREGKPAGEGKAEEEEKTVREGKNSGEVSDKTGGGIGKREGKRNRAGAGGRAGRESKENRRRLLERERTLVLALGEDTVRLKQYILCNKRGEETAEVFLLTDVGEYYELLHQSRELAVSEQRLAIEQERNRIAQEVHDTTGHTLTMIQSLLKLMRISTQKGGDAAAGDGVMEDYLVQAQELASAGIRELRWSINHMRQGTNCGLVTQGVYQLAGSVKELEIEVEIQGEDCAAYSHLSAVVYECLREAITNCLRYAHATHMDVIVKFAGKDIRVYIFDNGQGCGEIKESHGIRGIRERVKKAGGEVRFLSSEGEGFQIYFRLPLEVSRG